MSVAANRNQLDAAGGANVVNQSLHQDTGELLALVSRVDFGVHEVHLAGHP